jgi:hypothetical protein
MWKEPGALLFSIGWRCTASAKQVEGLGVEMVDVGRTLEMEGAATFAKSFDDLIETPRIMQAELAASHV